MEIIFRERGGPPPPPDQLQGFRAPDQIVVAETGASGGKGSALEALVSLLNAGDESPTSPNGGGLTGGDGVDIANRQINVKLSEDPGQTARFGSDDGLLVPPSGNGGVTFPLLMPDGTRDAPSLAFQNQPGLGFYRVATDQAMGLSGRLEINAAGNTLGLFVGTDSHCNVIIAGTNGRSALSLQDGSTLRWRLRKIPVGQGSHFDIVRSPDGTAEIVSLHIDFATGAVSLPEQNGLVLGISADANNALVQGSDNMFFVPDPAAPDPTTFISADANNALVAGTDSLLFVPDPAAPDPTTFISTDANNALVAGTDSLLFVPTPTPPAAATFISADAGNQIVQGTDNLLLVPETPPQIQGSVPTVADLPTTGTEGQYWIVEADGNLYGWEPAA